MFVVACVRASVRALRGRLVSVTDDLHKASEAKLRGTSVFAKSC